MKKLFIAIFAVVLLVILVISAWKIFDSSEKRVPIRQEQEIR